MKIKKVIILVVFLAVLSCIGGVMWYFTSNPVSNDDVSYDIDLKITSRSMYVDADEFIRSLEVLSYEYEKGIKTKEQITVSLQNIMYQMEGADDLYEYLPDSNTKLKGEICGAQRGDNPVGGGQGYDDIITKGTYIVSDADQLVNAIKKAKSGDVIFVQNDSKIDMTEYMYAENYSLHLNDGVTLASDRGYEGSKGGLIYTTAIKDIPMIRVSENVRITGLCLQGPDSEMREWKNSLGAGITIENSNVTIDNCEISGFNYTAVEVKDSDNIVIKNNYIHHNRALTAGYGVYAKAGVVLVEYNLFNYNRTSVAGDGSPECALNISNNIFMGTSYDAPVEMRKTEADGKVFFGDHIVLQNNTFITDQFPYHFMGLPKNGIQIINNYFFKKADEYTTEEQLESLRSEPDFIFKNNVYGLSDKVQSTFLNENLHVGHTPDMRFANITSRIYYGDLDKAYDILLKLESKLHTEEMVDEEIILYMKNAVAVVEGYGIAYEYLEKPNYTINGTVYGAIPDDQPLGGGYGYKNIYTTGDFVVEDTKEFVRALLNSKAGDVIFIKGDAVIDLTTVKYTLSIKEGVTVASDRGNGGSKGALIKNDSYFSPWFKAGANVRITGICFKGPDSERRIAFHARAFYGESPLGSSYYYKLSTQDGIVTTGSNLEVDNCELAGFSHAAINVSMGTGHYFHHNYIHHNQRNGLGYGIAHNNSVSLIEYNLFNYNRHGIAGTGAPGSGYEARHNVQMGVSLSHCFDMHGGSDRKDGTNIAGDTVLMHHNTFLSDKYPYWIRGIPQDIQDFYLNAMYAPLESYDKIRLYGSNDEQKAKFIVRDNLFNLENGPVVIP